MAIFLKRCSGFPQARPPSFWRCMVVNTRDAGTINARGEGKRQTPDAPGLLRFRSEIRPILEAVPGDLDRIAALRHWVRAQQSDDRVLWQFPPSVDTGDVDPETLLRQQRAFLPGACRRFGYLLAGALLSAGIPARLVSLQAFFVDGLGHIMVEAWVEQLGKWVLVDATYDTLFVVNRQYASLLELRKALLAGEADRIRFERNGSDREPVPSLEYFEQIPRHAFVFTNECLFTDLPLTKASVRQFRVLHYVDEEAEPYPEFVGKVLQTGAVVLATISSGLRRLR
jgi:Transglutaminase-like superfamily